MFLKKVVISGFRSFSCENPQAIEFDSDKTILIGNNGAGKSAILDALNRIFSVDSTMRVLKPSDFYSQPNEVNVESKSMFIDVWFGFETIEGDFAVPSLIDQLTLDSNEDIIFRVRLEATLNYEYSDLGDIDENVYIITTSENVPDEESKVKLTPLIRNSIQVHYVPASRDPLKQLAYSSTAILGRLLKATKWDVAARESYKEKTQEIVSLIKENTSLELISKSIDEGWKSLYKERVIANAELNFPFSTVDDLLKLVKLFLSPNEQGGTISSETLSDGQRSLLYLAIIHALFSIENKLKNSNPNDNEHAFDLARLRLPIFSLISLEEPENHLSPHYLGRIIRTFTEYTTKDSFQMIISTHSTAIMSRVEPHQVRHCSFIEGRSYVNNISLPNKIDEEFKFINEAVKAYPEVYFSKLVILVEGDSEQIILPRVFEHYDYNVDSKNITIAPLGGRHVNHFWRLLESIKIPYITLLDLDLGRSGGGFGRVQYAISQLSKYKKDKYLHEGMLEGIPAWDSTGNPLDFKMKYNDKNEINLVERLKDFNIFFSSPLDVDYLMINAYGDIYCECDKSNNETGPHALRKIKESRVKIEEAEVIKDAITKNVIVADETEKVERVRAEIIKAVLKDGHKGDGHYVSDPDYLDKFIWYNYRFLGNKSKPASHIRLLNKLSDKVIGEELPLVLKEIAEKAKGICDD
ncbi:ATP-dependent nuclease [Serratia fonticola]|uniref:ATP-dependent nuclease n=1 Tax=Serratia fonticola TaxID=47917 RepID=UPI00141559B8|nr:AAA family ATPase [Serratia fonticola]QIP92482.1 ATP-binding nuclease [Serratia fonticola]